MSTDLETISLPSFTTQVRRTGSGPTLVLVQGLGTDHRAWDPIVDRMSDHIEVITYDNRGVGNASDVGEDFGLDTLADDAAAVIEALADEPVHVAGVSMGGAIVMRLALRYPQLLRSLAIHSASAQPDNRTMAALHYRMKLLEGGLAPEFLRPFVSLWAWSPKGEFETLPEGAIDVSKFDATNYMGHLRAVARFNRLTDEELGQITTPTLVTVGSEDILTTPRHAAHIHRMIPDSKLVTIDGAAHAYYSEEPDIFAAIQLGWTLRNS